MTEPNILSVEEWNRKVRALKGRPYCGDDPLPHPAINVTCGDYARRLGLEPCCNCEEIDDSNPIEKLANVLRRAFPDGDWTKEDIACLHTATAFDPDFDPEKWIAKKHRQRAQRRALLNDEKV